MATVRSNMLTHAFSGSIGNIVFRQLHGKTIAARKPKEIEKQSALQRENRLRFRHAAAWAKAQMLDANKKAYYWRMAKKLKLPNAYTAAVSDYMRKGEIKEVDTRYYKGNAGDIIRLKITKKDFAIGHVDVVLRDATGNMIETGFAVRKDKDAFVYRAAKTIARQEEIYLHVTSWLTRRML
jgi:hypothetical protein